ncbi:TIGR00266 family protein, partial [Clostridium tertium]
VWIQSLPFSRLASRVFASAPQVAGDGRDEGSILGSLGNLFER